MLDKQKKKPQKNETESEGWNHAMRFQHMSILLGKF